MAAVAPPTLEHFGKPITVSIYGIAIDDFGVAVPGVSISVLAGQGTLATTTSTAKGQFGFPNLEVKVGFHSIRARGVDEQLVLTHEMDNSSITLFLRLEEHKLTSVEEMRRQEEIKRLEEAEARRQQETGRPAKERYSSVPEEKIEQAHKSPDEAKYVSLQILFATDRNQQFDSDPRKMFGNERSARESISFGICEVSIPNRHRIGTIERPSIFKFQFREDPDKHIILNSCERWEADVFYDRVARRATDSPNHDVFFFIHGYCVTFPEAILRTAQIAVDLNFAGVPICYSWPSRGNYSGYPVDEGNVEWSTAHLINVLRKTAQLSGVTTIHLIAHSMGNRALIRCLEQIAREFGNSSPAHINQVILAAPDIDAGVFAQLADTIAGVAKRTTLYASSSDTPLVISKQFHGYPRAGEIGDGLFINEKMDTIDASAVPADIFGHSYYGSSRTVLSDMYELFRNGTPPPRFGLQKASQEDKFYWIFRP